MPSFPTPPIRGPFRTDLRTRAAYAEGAGIYRIVPEGVARPEDVEDLAQLTGWASQTGTPLIPRGAGSAMGGGNVGDGIVVDLRRIGRRTLLVDPATSTARTGAAVTLGALDTAAAAYRLRLPPNPSSGRWATLGGMLSTNASGARSVRYGSVRPWVLAAELVTAEGDVVELRREGTARDAPAIRRFRSGTYPSIVAARGHIAERFPKVRKNSSGYAIDQVAASGDFLDILIGAEGTLGFVTAVTWRLDPIPVAVTSLAITLRDLDQLSEVVPALLALGPSGVELLDQSFLEVVKGTAAAKALGLHGTEAAVLLVEFEGETAAEAEQSCRQGAEVVEGWSAEVALALSKEEREGLRALRHAASPILAGIETRRSLQVIEDACVPVNRLAEYVAAVRRITREQEVPAVIFGHAGDGNVHVNLLPDVTRAGWETQVSSIYDQVTAQVLALGGTPSGEHGDGRLRAGLLRQVYGPEIVELFRQTKRDFDPGGILNPGVKLPVDGSMPIARLKVGQGAAPLPDDIAIALREIERTGGYEKDRMELAGG